jgi:TolB protein
VRLSRRQGSRPRQPSNSVRRCHEINAANRLAPLRRNRFIACRPAGVVLDIDVAKQLPRDVAIPFRIPAEGSIRDNIGLCTWQVRPMPRAILLPRFLVFVLFFLIVWRLIGVRRARFNMMTRRQGVKVLLGGVVAVPWTPTHPGLRKVYDETGRLRIPLEGSLQNPAWSPNGKVIVFTRFRRGYNEPPADLFTFDLTTGKVNVLISDGASNVSEPGTTWNRYTSEVIFSSDVRGHDEVWTIEVDENGRKPRQITDRSSLSAFEPSWAPDGKRIVFETHAIDDEENGRITVFNPTSRQYHDVTPLETDCRQPCWSPKGDLVVYQRQVRRGWWDLWLWTVDTDEHRRLTNTGRATDATFTPDGHVLYSADTAIYSTSVEGGDATLIASSDGYLGAPSWSPDGKWAACETSDATPDGGPGTHLRLIPLQGLMTADRANR